jgi:FkbM family methyltransferase
MKIATTVNGRDVELETFADMFSPGVTKGILAGETYAIVPGLQDVRTILDVGANLGAASVLFACHYPEATVHAFEPGPETYRLFVRNTAGFPNIVPHNFGLLDENDERPLYRGKGSPGEASIFHHPWVEDESDLVQLRNARAWSEEAQIERIDILKVDTEGCELPIFRGLAGYLPEVQVVYLEFHSKDDWRELDAMLSPTHELMAGKVLFENGELVYLAKDRYEALRRGIDAAHEAAG